MPPPRNLLELLEIQIWNVLIYSTSYYLLINRLHMRGSKCKIYILLFEALYTTNIFLRNQVTEILVFRSFIKIGPTLSSIRLIGSRLSVLVFLISSLFTNSSSLGYSYLENSKCRWKFWLSICKLYQCRTTFGFLKKVIYFWCLIYHCLHFF